MAIAIYLASASCTFFAIAEALPDMRPALVGSGRDALINLIDTKRLLEKGQDHAAILLYCDVQPNGQVRGRLAYNGTPGSEKLKDEINRCVRKAIFIPAVYNHRKTYAAFFETVVFSVNNGKTRLRIFANQEQSEVQHETDFIGPQPIFIPGHYYDSVKYPERSWASDDVPGVAEMLLSIDATGKLTDVQLLRENPPGNRFGETAVKEMWTRTYLPAFRNGRPVDSKTHFILIFRPGYWGFKR